MIKRRYIFLIFLTIFLFQNVAAKGLSGSSAGVKSGFSLFHNYEGFSRPGFNVQFSYDPYLAYSINIDTALFIHYAQDGLNNLIYPGISFGPRYNVNIYPVTTLFVGSGLNFIAGVEYSSKDDMADAFFTPGFYLKLGSIFLAGRVLSIGLEAEYIWSMAHLDHLFSINFRMDLLL